MKNQLLEDLDDSQSSAPVLPVRRVQAVPPPQQPAARQRAGVWRSRAASPPPLHAAPPPQSGTPGAAAPGAAAPAAAARIEPRIASFSSPEPDWTIPLPQDDPPWTERWGRKALGWTAAAGLAVALAATAAWMVRETQVESTLAVVADHTPAPAVVAAPAAPAEPAPEAPPLRLLPPEPAAAAPRVAAEETPPRVEQATATPAPERRVARAVPVQRKRAEARKPAPRPARERALARADTPPVRRPAPVRPAAPATAAPPAADSPLAETLRLCRAAGYHATACIKRGCEATRYGLACRG